MTGCGAKAGAAPQGKGGGLGYTVNKDGKAVALRRRPQEAQEPQGDVRFRRADPRPGQVLTQHTGLPPRATGAAKPRKKGR
jgi:hypothetical protein